MTQKSLGEGGEKPNRELITFMGPREEAGLPPYWATWEGEHGGQDRRKG